MSDGDRERKSVIAEIASVEKQIGHRRAEGGNERELKDLERRWLYLQSELVKTRLHPRLPFLAEAWVTLPDKTEVPAQTKDVSMGGIALRTIPGCLSTGDLVRVEMTLSDPEQPKVVLDGQVAWTTGDCAGVAFSLEASRQVLPLLHAAMSRAVDGLEAATEQHRSSREED